MAQALKDVSNADLDSLEALGLTVDLLGPDDPAVDPVVPDPVPPVEPPKKFPKEKPGYLC